MVELRLTERLAEKKCWRPIEETPDINLWPPLACEMRAYILAHTHAQIYITNRKWRKIFVLSPSGGQPQPHMFLYKTLPQMGACGSIHAGFHAGLAESAEMGKP